MRPIDRAGKLPINLPKEIRAVLTDSYCDTIDLLREINSAIRKRHVALHGLEAVVQMFVLDDNIITNEPVVEEFDGGVNYDILLECLESMAANSEIDRSFRNGDPVFRRRSAAR